MARKSKTKGFLIIAALIGGGAYFHETLTKYFNQAKEALHVK